MAGTPVLIVDDVPTNLKVARVALEAEGYDVTTAANGEDAWRLLISYEPRLILLDMQMPGMDGFELARRIKSDPSRSHILIVAATAYAMKGDRERALAAGCDGYVAKPLDPIALPHLIANYLGDASGGSILRPGASARTVLVIDDNPTTRKLIRVTLESEGYGVVEAADGRAAMSWVEGHTPCLILQDLILPDMDGLELVQKLRTLPHARAVPILCLSGFLARVDDARAIKNGFSAILIKPVDPIQLLEVVRVHLETPSSQPPAAPSLDGPHVLVVDDDPLQRRLAEYHLTSAGFRVTAMAGVKAALREAERSLPDAIVSDVLMPEMDGFEFCLTIRRHPLLARIPVVLISSHFTDAADRKLAEQVGASAYIPRSGDWAGALERLREALGRKGAPAPQLEAEVARDAILRRTLVQLERQLGTNTRLNQRCLFQAAQLSVLAGVAEALARNAKLDSVLGDVLAVCMDLAGISKGALYLRRDGSLMPKHWIGFNPEEADGLVRFFDHPKLLEEIVAGGQVTAIPSAQIGDDATRTVLTRTGVSAALVVPVAWGQHTYGALLLGARSSDVTGEEPIAFARVLGAQMGQAIGLADTFDQLHASEQKFRGMVNAMDYVTVIDRNQRIVALFGRGLQRERVDVDAVIGKGVHDVLPNDPAAHAEAQARALSGETVVYEWSVASGAEERHFQSALFPVFDAEGKVQSLVRVGTDVTEKKRLQAQVMVSDRMASVGMLAAGVAHEINNPLTAVLGNLQHVLGESAAGSAALSPEVREALTDSFEAAERVESIVSDLRLFSRAEEERNSAVDIHAVLESTLRMARNEIRHRASLVTDFAEVPAVQGNGSRLGQVFLNLLVNAAQAIPEGCADANEIRVSTRLDSLERVVVEIRDTGPGIPLELRDKLFSPFVTTKPAGIGTGLGLAICKRIVTMLAGEIAFESELGKGTVFRVTLPPAAGPVRDTRPPSHVPAARRRGSVLVIDDDAALRSLVQRSLLPEHDVVCAADAGQALELLRGGSSFDVILCDLMMPHVSGVQFFSELSCVRPELAKRTVFLSGGAFTLAAREFLEKTAPQCLEKPFDLSALRRLVNERVA